MKMSNVFYALLILVSCNTITMDNVPEGMYVCRHKNEFSKTEDTLLLKKINNNYYHVERHSAIKLKDKPAKKYIIENWHLEYDNNKKSLIELKTGKTLIWNPDKNILLLGSRIYVKMKS